MKSEKNIFSCVHAISDLGNTENAEKISSTRIMRRHATGTAPIELTTVAIERGISWEEILEK